MAVDCVGHQRWACVFFFLRGVFSRTIVAIQNIGPGNNAMSRISGHANIRSQPQSQAIGNQLLWRIGNSAADRHEPRELLFVESDVARLTAGSIEPTALSAVTWTLRRASAGSFLGWLQRTSPSKTCSWNFSRSDADAEGGSQVDEIDARRTDGKREGSVRHRR